jgi:hypothetical protein
MRRMRWFKVAAIAGGILIAFLIVSAVIGTVLHLVIDVVIAVLVVGAIAVAIKVARSNRQVSRKKSEREVREPEYSSRPLPRADVEPVSTSVPPRQAAPDTQDIDDELARLKREMGS